jgi:alpha-beta hydrolase superfamily lysophospholipase
VDENVREDEVEDVLGTPYRKRVIDLGRDDEGPVVATLVSRKASKPTGRAVLYVHGFIDYFFQTHLADFYVDRGWDFHALDLRKYGRSLLPHQTPNFCRNISDYFPDLDAAVELIGADQLLVNGHSTGGLIASLWANERRHDDIVHGLFLNSPFFDFNAPWWKRRPLLAAVSALGRRQPYRVVPLGMTTVYGESIHAEHRGEWTYDLAWKPIEAFPIRAGWFRAIGRGQRQLRAGLKIPVPILLACSTRSFKGATWHDSAAYADAVLDVEHMVKYAPRLGPQVTVVRIDGGKHDLTLSGPEARERVFSEVGRWIDAYLPARRDADAAGGVAEAGATAATHPDARRADHG